MKSSTNHAFVNKLLVYMLLTIGFNGTVGLWTVWLRHQISETAAATKTAENLLASIDRRLAETTARLAAEQAPDVLEQKNQTMHLGLVRPAEANIVRIDESPEERLAAKRNLEIFANEASAGTLSVSFTLADRSTR